MAQSPKVDQPPVSSGSSTPRVAVPVFPALVAVAPAPLTDDEQRQQDARQRALLMLSGEPDDCGVANVVTTSPVGS